MRLGAVAVSCTVRSPVFATSLTPQGIFAEWVKEQIIYRLHDLKKLIINSSFFSYVEERRAGGIK